MLHSDSCVERTERMRLFSYFSDLIIPVFMLYIVAHGLVARRDIYNDFLDGAKEGMHTVADVLPTLIGLMTATGILRASGFLDVISSFIEKFTNLIGFPGELVPLSIVKMFSSSAASGLLVDLYKTYGTDSRIGLIASLSMSCTETIFYTMSVYFMTARIRHTRYTLPGAVFATFAGLAASVLLAGYCS